MRRFLSDDRDRAAERAKDGQKNGAFKSVEDLRQLGTFMHPV
jgi:hypothetical protein